MYRYIASTPYRSWPAYGVGCSGDAAAQMIERKREWETERWLLSHVANQSSSRILSNAKLQIKNGMQILKVLSEWNPKNIKTTNKHLNHWRIVVFIRAKQISHLMARLAKVIRDRNVFYLNAVAVIFFTFFPTRWNHFEWNSTPFLHQWPTFKLIKGNASYFWLVFIVNASKYLRL